MDVSRGPDYGKGLVEGVTRKSVALADLNGDGKQTLLVASGKSFARALRLDAKDHLEIVEQFNGRSPTSEIVAAPLRRWTPRPEGGPAVQIVLADTANHCLTVLKPNKAGVYEEAENLQIGAMGLQEVHVADLEGAGKPAVLLAGQNDFTHPAVRVAPHRPARDRLL